MQPETRPKGLKRQNFRVFVVLVVVSVALFIGALSLMMSR